MKNKLSFLAASILTFTLVSCGSATSSSNSSESSSDITSSETITDSSSSTEEVKPDYDRLVSFEDSLAVLDKAYIEEVLHANNEKFVNVTQSGSVSTSKIEELNIFDDHSSQGRGSYSKKDKNKDIEFSDFVTRTTRQVDKIEVDGKARNYNMFAKVLDYEKDNLSGSHYDMASKVYVVANETEAQNAGLSEGQYIVAEQSPILATLQIAHELKVFVVGSIMQNPYAGQIADQNFRVKDMGLSEKYYRTMEYSYNGDLNDKIVETIDVSFSIDKETSRLLSCDYSLARKDINLADESDVYESLTGGVGVLTYQRRNPVPSDAIKVDDYFLERVTGVQMMQLGGRVGYEPVDSNKVSLTSTYIKAKAKTYSPSKAVNVDLICTKSSNENVVKLDETGMMEVVGAGETNLTFTYFGKDNGVYKEKKIVETINVILPPVKSVAIIVGNQIKNNTLDKGVSYNLKTHVGPDQANQAISAESSDPSIISVEVIENNELKIVGLKRGQATITIKSVENPQITDSVTFTVFDDSIDYGALLVGKHYFEDRHDIGGTYVADLYFEADGQGKLILTGDEDPETHKVAVETYLFQYQVNGNKISFTWGEDAWYIIKFDYGTIKDLQANLIVCEVEETYGTFEFDIVK